ncbi:DoxX-like family protein, partial [Rhizobium hidalgonense]
SGEILLGMLLIIFHQKNWPIWTSLGFLSFLLLDIIVLAPELLTGAFNPLSINIAAMLLAYIALQPKVSRWKIS